jgi:hypothetical protein
MCQHRRVAEALRRSVLPPHLIEGLEDLDSIGGRAGLYFTSGKGVYVGAGLVYENYLSCQTSIYSSCDDTYPELIVAFTF